VQRRAILLRTGTSTKTTRSFSSVWKVQQKFYEHLHQSRRHGGALVGLAPPNKAPSPPIEK